MENRLLFVWLRWDEGSDVGMSVSGMGTAIIEEEAGRSGYSDYGSHADVSYGGHGGYGGMAKYIDPFTVLAFGIFCAFLAYIYFYCIIKKNCIQFAACTDAGTGGRRIGTNDIDSQKAEDISELFSMIDGMLTVAQEAWEGEVSGNSTNLM